ncbi:unnamed protein product [Strongylus vulgaris]|uniref:Major facilitator superfamily (MFS) profile domain-containing protein n=1 Tax=Strongylus vulgaris TaxID=40348 RepID=A0A3P7KER3_STRVU|nr:unnamed protein product [Strongylus vulgaris]
MNWYDFLGKCGKTLKILALFHPYSRRLHLVMLLGFGFCCTTFMRMHLAITMTCMVNSTAISLMEEEVYYPEHFNSTIDYELVEQRRAEDGHTIVVDYGGTLTWSHQMQNFIFSGTFWGALVVVGPSTLVYHRCSPRLLLVAAVAIYIVSTAVTPFLAVHFGTYPVFIARVFMGFGEGFVIPSINAMIANWFPVEEKGTVLALYTTGNQFAGTSQLSFKKNLQMNYCSKQDKKFPGAAGNPLAAAFCASSLGWPAVFYFIGDN